MMYPQVFGGKLTSEDWSILNRDFHLAIYGCLIYHVSFGGYILGPLSGSSQIYFTWSNASKLHLILPLAFFSHHFYMLYKVLSLLQILVHVLHLVSKGEQLLLFLCENFRNFILFIFLYLIFKTFHGLKFLDTCHAATQVFKDASRESWNR